MSNQKFFPIIGLEVHAELKTKSKMFCSCPNDPFHAEKPNIFTCPVCLGLPGGLPVANQAAIEWTIKLGLALHCQINLCSKFDRKHYFYPDLPKGYQISQYDLPFCHDGYIDTSEGRVRIRRIHLEEDTAKLVHKEVNGIKVSLIDFNRSSVPLVEVVTEPDIQTGTQAKEYAKKLRQTLRFLNIADCDMEQGGMRLEANISLSPKPYNPEQSDFVLPNYKVEVKNINSFRFMEQAVNYELERQAVILNASETPVQETRGWDSVNNKTFSQRTKEDAADYRYFPDPDLPPFQFSVAQIETWRAELPELPEQLLQRWLAEFELAENLGAGFTETPHQAQWWETVMVAAKTAQFDVTKLAKAVINKKISTQPGADPKDICAKFQALATVDEVSDSELETAIATVLTANTDAVTKYRSGKTQIIGFLIGQVTRTLGKKIDPQVIQAALVETLK
ncbi:MAG TPA: Asp-tRNA(Asn)/Glu-tRNA(Gln) amidotransferase subunit GatB [Candidatus Pacebacteria bacterium]|nr:Asp-tRNA(Asn)/Glu-tRNA(Gln) amidotransferase subunit GatB [Candidatus Paceibacterota bacterium]